MSNNNLIYSIESRDNFMLSLMKDFFKLDGKEVSNEIRSYFAEFRKHFKPTNINYEDLKYALVPNKSRKEYLFAFDSAVIKDYAYGAYIFNKIIKGFDKSKAYNILSGDLLDFSNGKYIKSILEMFFNELGVEYIDEKRFTNRFYCIYINNLSDSDIEKLVDLSKKMNCFIGCADMTYSCPLKTYLTKSIGTRFIIYKDKIINGHEPDINEIRNYNMPGYDFEENGYNVISIQGNYFSVFMSYLISSDIVVWKEEKYKEIISNLITNQDKLSKIDFILLKDKIEYIESAKRTMTRLGFEKSDHEKIYKLILEKMRDNMIHNIDFSLLEEFGIVKFNIVFDYKSQGVWRKFVCTLKYEPDNEILKLVTMY